MESLLWDKSDAKFSNDELAELNEQLLEHYKTCDKSDLGTTYGLWFKKGYGFIQFAECFCGKRVYYGDPNWRAYKEKLEEEKF